MEKSNQKNISTPLYRFLAFVVDSLAYSFLFLIVANSVLAKNPTALIEISVPFVTYVLLAGTIIFPFVQIYLTSKFGGSVGKLLFGLSVVDKDGKYLNIKMAFFRNYLGSIVSSSFFGLGYIWILLDKKRRAWHDMMAGTLVVKRKQNYIGLAALILLAIAVIWLGNKVSGDVIPRITGAKDSMVEILNEVSSEIPEN